MVLQKKCEDTQIGLSLRNIIKIVPEDNMRHRINKHVP